MGHKFLSRRYWESGATAMWESDEFSKKYDDIINLSIGDPDLITDDIIIENAFKDAKLGHTKYTDPKGDPELRTEIAKYYKDDYGIDVKDEEIMVTAGGCVAMYLTLEAILNDGDEVIIHTPCFFSYTHQITLARGIPVPLITYEQDGFQINPKMLEEKITKKTKAIIINTPTNPTGACFSFETLKGIADIAIKHDLLVIADDIYRVFSFEEPFVPIMGIDGMKERTITVNSFSKDYIMTGWRVGNIVAPANIIHVIREINENLVFTTPSVSQRGAVYAIRNRSEIQSKILAEYKKRVIFAASKINAIPKLSVLPPKGTFYLFVNIKETGLTSFEVADKIFNEAHVLVVPGDALGEGGEGYLRLACTCPTDKLEEAFGRIAKMPLFMDN